MVIIITDRHEALKCAMFDTFFELTVLFLRC